MATINKESSNKNHQPVHGLSQFSVIYYDAIESQGRKEFITDIVGA